MDELGGIFDYDEASGMEITLDVCNVCDKLLRLP